MICKRCGCEINSLNADGKWNFERDTYSHDDKNNCIAALKAKLAEKSEPTKPERFERLRTLIGNSDAYIGSYTRIYLIDEVKDLLAAFDEAKVLLGNYIYPEFINWRDKWK
jgi:hypothetical protein